MKRDIRDWVGARVDDEHHPCVVDKCWVEALAPRRALCAAHEMAYIARHGHPSPEVTPQQWGVMLDMQEFK